jgi:two-component system, OmpR family, KDP operon response regulator KdpE
VRLTPTEWQLVEALVAEPGKLIGQRQLLQRVGSRPTRPKRVIYASTWRNYGASSRTIPRPPRHLITEPGMGYRFQP